MKTIIALAGNPNCGKTTIFNELTGGNQYVGNWPGVTVEKKEGEAIGFKDVTIVDLPGVYSLSPFSIDEVITRNFLVNEKVDVILNVVDASNLERNLYLTTQLLEIGIPVVIALNMMDIIEKNGDRLDIGRLQEKIHCPIIETSAKKSIGLKKAVAKAVTMAQGKADGIDEIFNKAIYVGIANIQNQLPQHIDEEKRFWYALKVMEGDQKILEQLQLEPLILDKINGMTIKDADDIIAGERYAFIEKIIGDCFKRRGKDVDATTEAIDSVVTNKYIAIPLFFMIMGAIYYIAIQSVGAIANGWIDTFFNDYVAVGLTEMLMGLGTAPWLQSLLVDGILAGVGGVLTFVPQLILLFFMLSFLEDCGYMMRVAFIMDKVFHKFGLSGKSFIPMIIGTGCSVPGIMAARTIENEKDRRMTIMLTPFIPCGAKLPIFALFAAALFPNNPWVGPSMYLVGIVMVILSGLLLKNSKLFEGQDAQFVMELPKYSMPKMSSMLTNTWDKAKSFIIKAGTIIFVASGCIWFLQSFSWSLQMVDPGESMLASMGRVIAPIFTPLGFGNWQSTVAILTGFMAKETTVATFGILLGAGEVAGDATLVSNIASMFTQASGYAFMVFVLLASPCFAAIATIKREMNSWKWTLITIGFQTGTAYLIALLINQIGTIIAHYL